MLGDRIMVAPVVEKGTQRSVRFPKGRWKTEEGMVIKGPVVRTMPVPIDRLLWFERVGK
jgi:alpha-glucosidase